MTSLTSTQTTLPYQEVLCGWDFGDSSAGTWSYGGPNNSRNSAPGQIAAHVYGTVGTFTPSVTCNDGSSIQKLTLPSITTLDPNTTWAGTATLCIYNSSLGSGCPTGADTYSTVDGVAAFAYATSAGPHAPYKRILFKGGDTFRMTSAPNWPNAAGPGIVSSYGTGKATISQTSSGVHGIGISANDWRITNLVVSGVANPSDSGSYGVTIGTGQSQITIDAVDVSGFAQQINFTGNGVTGADRVVVANSTTNVSQSAAGASSGASSYAIFGGTSVGGAYVAFLGNLLQLSPSWTGFVPSHPIRMQPTCRWCVVTNNTIANDGYTQIKMDAHFYSSNNDMSLYIEVANNRFPSTGNTVLMAQNLQSDERLRYAIVEGNWWGRAGNPSAPTLNIAAPNTTIRNNIFDGRNTSGGANAINIGQYGTAATPAPNNVFVYNNTFYTDNTSPATYIQFMQTCHNNSGGTTMGTLTVMNNVVYLPNATSPLFDEDHCSSSTKYYQNNTNMTSTGSGTNPVGTSQTESPGWTNATGTYSTPSDFKPGSGSYLIGAGASVPVWADFLDNQEPLPRDIGAVAH